MIDFLAPALHIFLLVVAVAGGCLVIAALALLVSLLASFQASRGPQKGELELVATRPAANDPEATWPGQEARKAGPGRLYQGQPLANGQRLAKPAHESTVACRPCAALRKIAGKTRAFLGRSVWRLPQKKTPA